MKSGDKVKSKGTVFSTCGKYSTNPNLIYTIDRIIAKDKYFTIKNNKDITFVWANLFWLCYNFYIVESVNINLDKISKHFE
jgi:hypothetical protein